MNLVPGGTAGFLFPKPGDPCSAFRGRGDIATYLFHGLHEAAPRLFAEINGCILSTMKRITGVLAFGLPVTALLILSVPGCSVVRPYTTRLLGEARVTAPDVPAPQLDLPAEPRRSPGAAEHLEQLVNSEAKHEFPYALLREWAAHPLPDWQEEGKVRAPRILLAKLILEVDVPEVNEYIQAVEPWSGIGSTWWLRSSGDYDFSLPPLTAILYLFGDSPDLLYPETREHLLHGLLNQEGDDFQTTVPGSMRLVTETENHILMTEGPRYLKNQWLAAHGSQDPAHDNRKNGMQDKLVAFLDEMHEAGPFEYNSYPYLGYTVMATLLLEAFAEPPVADAARTFLDGVNWEYALGSSRLRRYAPYRRQSRHRGITDLHDHPHTSVMAVWMAWNDFEESATETALDRVAELETSRHHAFFAAIMPYRLPEPVSGFVDSAHGTGDVRLARGPGVSPEVYSRGTGYLISAGGTGDGRDRQIVPRKTILLLDDGARDLEEVIHIVPDEEDYRRWNNTGVVDGLAVGSGSVHVPRMWEPAAGAGPWSVYDREDVFIASAQVDGIAMFLAVDRAEAAALCSVEPEGPGIAECIATELSRQNSESQIADGRVVLLDGTEVQFDVAAAVDTWVIAGVDGVEKERAFARWPRNAGTLNPARE